MLVLVHDFYYSKIDSVSTQVLRTRSSESIIDCLLKLNPLRLKAVPDDSLQPDTKEGGMLQDREKVQHMWVVNEWHIILLLVSILVLSSLTMKKLQEFHTWQKTMIHQVHCNTSRVQGIHQDVLLCLESQHKLKVPLTLSYYQLA